MAPSTEEKIAAAMERWLDFNAPNVSDRCESPIEELLLWALLNTLDAEHIGRYESHAIFSSFFETLPKRPKGDRWDPVELRRLIPLAWPFVEIGCGWYVYPQFPTLDYRLDFAVVELREVRRRYAATGRKIAVECDGHDFHERTKEQAARDKRRDRCLAADGWTVLRFSGSEIYADADRCASEVVALAENASLKRRA